ncbi:hypothetical protein KKF84_03415 [Myxococcota bacterium]|nr:hypothetical protein [Myxococcota bacterium]
MNDGYNIPDYYLPDNFLQDFHFAYGRWSTKLAQMQARLSPFYAAVLQ